MDRDDDGVPQATYLGSVGMVGQNENDLRRALNRIRRDSAAGEKLTGVDVDILVAIARQLSQRTKVPA